MHDMHEQSVQQRAGDEARLTRLMAEKRELEHKYKSAAQGLARSEAYIKMLEQSLELDGALQDTSSDTVNLSGRTASHAQMWMHVDFTLLRRERSRRLETLREKKQQVGDLTDDLNSATKHHHDALEVIDNLRLKAETLKLCGSESVSIVDALKDGADGPRPWVKEEKTAPKAVGSGAGGLYDGAASSGAAAEDEGGGNNDPLDRMSWTFKDWIESLELQDILAEPFELVLKDSSSGDYTQQQKLASAEGRRAFLHALSKKGSKETIVAMLRATPLLDLLSERIWTAVKTFGSQLDLIAKGIAERQAEEDEEMDELHASTGAESIDWDDPNKFMKKAPRKLIYAPVDKFYSTLNENIGEAAAGGLMTMAREHTVRDDADIDFIAPNYNILTTSKLEWYLVAEPRRALDLLGLDDWPEGGGHTSVALGFRKIDAPDSEFFLKKRRAVDLELREAGDLEPITDELFVGARLYTGPLYMKYNFVLRGAYDKGAFIQAYLHRHCKTNTYPTTLLYLCLAINKLSRISHATKVYRAPGGQLPPSFFEGDAAMRGARGGVEMGFMSTSTDKMAAMEYAASSGMPLIFEVQQGLVARGANVAWLSQFPAESEVLFGPLTSLEVHRIRSDGAYSVVELRPAVSSASRVDETRLLSDERLIGVLNMLRSGRGRQWASTALFGGRLPPLSSQEQRDDEAREAADDGIDTVLERAQMSHANQAIMRQVTHELQLSAEAMARRASTRARASDHDSLMGAMAANAQKRALMAAAEARRSESLEATAVRDLDGTETMMLQNAKTGWMRSMAASKYLRQRGETVADKFGKKLASRAKIKLFNSFP